MKIEYKVRPVTRYVVTRFESFDPIDESGNTKCSKVTERGEHVNADVAYEVAYALCKQEHEHLGFPIGDERIQYPLHPSGAERAFAPDQIGFARLDPKPDGAPGSI